VARRTHGGLAIDLSGSAGTLVANGWLRRSGEPEYVYRTGGRIVAGIWTTGPDAAVVRSGVTETAPVIGRIVPSWNDNALSLAIEPAASDPVRTGAFERENGAGLSTLSRNASTREDLEGSYRAGLRTAKVGDAGWLTVDVDPEGGTRFRGDLPRTIPPALAAAAAAAVDGEVDRIYGDVDDVSPLRR
jgi:hypothetical protein